MAETLNVNIDQLPELGTKAAAVAAIESLIFRAIGAKDLEPLQLRYWLDAYYQARKAAELQDYYTLVDRVYMEDATPHQSPPATASPQGEAKKSPVITIREEDLEDGAPMSEIIERELRRMAKGAGIEIEEGDGADEGSPSTVSAPPEQTDESDGQNPPAADAAAPFRQRGLDGGPMKASAPTEETDQKPRQKPVGWTDGFEAVEVKRSGAAEAAAYKREQFARLQRLRGEGVSTPEILKAAEGNISEDQLRGIMECRRVPVAVYRVLEAALDQVEKSGLPRGARRPRND